SIYFPETYRSIRENPRFRTHFLTLNPFPHGVAKQQYLPDDIASTRYYDPTDHGNEAAIAQRLSQIRALLGRDIEEEKS
ncbi:hypothetical protein U6N17_11310, partial [Cutibacterium acnes]